MQPEVSGPQPVKIASGGGWLVLKIICVGPLPGPIMAPGGAIGVGLGVGVGTVGGMGGDSSLQASRASSSPHAATRLMLRHRAGTIGALPALPNPGELRGCAQLLDRGLETLQQLDVGTAHAEVVAEAIERFSDDA